MIIFVSFNNQNTNTMNIYVVIQKQTNTIQIAFATFKEASEYVNNKMYPNEYTISKTILA